MSEVENNITCDNCGSKFTIIYDTEDVSYDPENCPFCGDTLNLDEVELEDNDYEEEIDLEDDERLH